MKKFSSSIPMAFLSTNLKPQPVDYKHSKSATETCLCYITGISNKRKEPDMKFNERLDQAAAVVPAYRQTIFRTLIMHSRLTGNPGESAAFSASSSMSSRDKTRSNGFTISSFRRSLHSTSRKRAISLLQKPARRKVRNHRQWSRSPP